MRYIPIDSVIAKLADCGILKANHLLEKQKPTHGNCCTCQDCGHGHDECICEHNEVLTLLREIKGIDR